MGCRIRWGLGGGGGGGADRIRGRGREEMASHTFMTKQELESGISKDEADRTSSIKKQNRDILGMGFCKKGIIRKAYPLQLNNLQQ